MIAALGKGMIEKLAAADKPYEVRDVKLRGLLLRVQPSGVKTYYCEYERGRRIRLGRADAISTDDARREARKIFGQASSGVDPAAERRKLRASTYREFLDNHYVPWALSNNSCGDQRMRHMKSCFRHLLDCRLNEISLIQIEQWRTKRLEAGRRPSTVNRDLSELKASLNRAVDWGIIDANPIARVKPLKVDSARKVRRALDICSLWKCRVRRQ